MSVEQAATAETALADAPAKRGESRILGPLVVGLALFSAFITFIVLADLTPVSPTHNVVVTLLLVNAVTVLLLLGIIVREVWQVVQARRSGRAGARLHVRIVGLFSIIAAVPAIMVAIVASVTLDRGLDRLFSTRTRSAIENSLIVAEAYLRDNAQIVRSDIMVMAFDIARSKALFEQDPDKLRQFLTFQASVRGLGAAIVVDKDLNVVARANVNINQTFALPPRDALSHITEKEPQIVLLPDANYVAAVIKIEQFDSHYLYTTRLLDPRVVPQLQATRASVTEYAALEARRLGVQVAFALMYTVIALIVLLSAVWIGFNFANRMVAPIRRLIGAANAVSTGNLYVRVPVREAEGDLAHLGETFNRMTQELRTQRDDIMHAHDLIDSRRRFTEAVLAGASAGVIGVDSKGNVSILNRSAEKLIGRAENEALGHPLIDVLPELADTMAAVKSGAPAQNQITISRNGRERNLSIRVTSEQSADADRGYVVTLDDITELVAAQRTSAWADVARRIAHEIKNPLTPMRLGVQHLRRVWRDRRDEFGGALEETAGRILAEIDRLDTIARAFSRFAAPALAQDPLEPVDLAAVASEVVHLYQLAGEAAGATVRLDVIEHAWGDSRRDELKEVLVNLLENARNAGARSIVVTVSVTCIQVRDDGSGIPVHLLPRIFEPRFSTTTSGSGLGLAIVRRLVESWGGSVEVDSEVGQGTSATIRFATGVAPTAAAGGN